jgi:hypothetical protein
VRSTLGGGVVAVSVGHHNFSMQLSLSRLEVLYGKSGREENWRIRELDYET